MTTQRPSANQLKAKVGLIIYGENKNGENYLDRNYNKNGVE